MFTYYENLSSKLISIPQYTVQNVERLEGVNTYAAVITMEEISYHVKETERKWKEKVSEYWTAWKTVSISIALWSFNVFNAFKAFLFLIALLYLHRARFQVAAPL